MSNHVSEKLESCGHAVTTRVREALMFVLKLLERVPCARWVTARVRLQEPLIEPVQHLAAHADADARLDARSRPLPRRLHMLWLRSVQNRGAREYKSTTRQNLVPPNLFALVACYRRRLLTHLDLHEHAGHRLFGGHWQRDHDSQKISALRR